MPTVNVQTLKPLLNYKDADKVIFVLDFKQNMGNLQTEWFCYQINNFFDLEDFEFWLYIVVGSEPHKEDSAVFRNKESRSVLGIAMILPKKYSDHIIYFDFVSNVLNHDAKFAVDCLHSIISSTEPRYVPTDIKRYEVWSDCGMHFRCKEFLTYVTLDIPSLTNATEASCNLFPEQHGKNLVDSHFSVVAQYLEVFLMKKINIYKILSLSFCSKKKL